MKTIVRRLFRFTGWPMAAKLLATFGLIALLPLLIVGRYGYTVARRAVLQAQVRALTSHTTVLAARLDSLLAERQRNIRLLAADPAVRSFSAAWPDVSPQAQSHAQEHLLGLAQTNPYFQAVYLMNQEGDVILSSTDNVGLNFGFRPYFREALAGNAHISDISISVDLGRPVIYFSAPVQDEAGQVAAVAVLGMRAEEIWALVEAQKDASGPGSVAILFDEYGLRLAHASDRTLLFKAVVPLDPQVEAQLLAERRLGERQAIESTNFPELAEGMRQAESQPYFTHRLAIGDELYHAGAARLTTRPWTVIETVPESAFLAPIRQIRWTSDLATGAVTLLALLVTALATWQIVKPIRDLTQAARRLARGELDQPLAGLRFQPEDELGVLVQSFEAMRVNLKQSYAQLEARNNRLRQLYELAVALSGDVTAVAGHVVTIVAELLDVKVAAVEEISQDKIGVVSLYHQGQIVNAGEFPLRGTPCANVREEKNVCQYSQAVADFPDDAFLATYGLNTYLGVPILDSQGEVLGVVNAMDDRPRVFDAEDVQLLQTLAGRIGFEIERSRAEVELRRRVGELEAIAEVGGLVTAGGDLPATLDSLARRIGEAAGFDGVGIRLYNAEKQELTSQALFTTHPMQLPEGRKGATLRLQESPLLQQLLRDKQPIFSDPPSGGGGPYADLAPTLRRRIDRYPGAVQRPAA